MRRGRQRGGRGGGWTRPARRRAALSGLHLPHSPHRLLQLVRNEPPNSTNGGRAAASRARHEQTPGRPSGRPLPRVRAAFDSSNHRPLSPPPFQVRGHSPPSRTAPAPSPPPRAPASRCPSPALSFSPAHTCAPRPAVPDPGAAAARLAAPRPGGWLLAQRPSPGTFLGRKCTHLTCARRQVGLLRRAGRAGVSGVWRDGWARAGCEGPLRAGYSAAPPNSRSRDARCLPRSIARWTARPRRAERRRRAGFAAAERRRGAVVLQ